MKTGRTDLISYFVTLVLFFAIGCADKDDPYNNFQISDNAELASFRAIIDGKEFQPDLTSDENFVRWKRGSDFTIKVKNSDNKFIELFNVGDLLGDHMASGNINLGVDDGCIAYYEKMGLRYDCISAGAETNVTVLKKTKDVISGTFNGTLVGFELYDELEVSGSFELRAR